MSNKPVMVVEDDKDIRENLLELLESDGYSVSVASNGKEALEMLRASESLPGLIFLDLMMPVMDGRGFLKEIELDSRLCQLPVVVVTAATEKVSGKISGFLKKPLDLLQVLGMAEKFCSRP